MFGLSVQNIYIARALFFLGGGDFPFFFSLARQVLQLFDSLFRFMPGRGDERPITPERRPPSPDADSYYSSEETVEPEVRPNSARLPIGHRSPARGREEQPRRRERAKRAGGEKPREEKPREEKPRRRERSKTRARRTKTKSPRERRRRRKGEAARAAKETSPARDRSTSASTITRAARQPARGGSSSKGPKGKGKQRKVQCDLCWGWYHKDGLDFHKKTSEVCLAYQIHAKQKKKDWDAVKEAAAEVRWRRDQEWKQQEPKPTAEETKNEESKVDSTDRRHRTGGRAPSPARDKTPDRDRGRRRRAEPAEDARERGKTRRVHSTVFSPERAAKETRDRK